MGFVASQATDMTQIGAQIQTFFQHAATVADSQTSTLASYHNDTLNESLTITGDNMTQFAGFPAMGTIYTIEFDAPIGTVAYTFSFSNFVVPVNFDQDFFADLLAGDDTITGSAFNDVLIGGAGLDTLDGGAGIDTADYSNETDSVFVFLNGAADAVLTINGVPADTLRNIENVIGGSGDDRLAGDSLNNALYGGGGDDWLTGGQGIDALNGGADNDTLKGGAGKDTLKGGAGKDTLTGGRGHDLLTGGAGNDRFDFNSLKDSVKGANRDQILDFTHSQGDRIDLKTIDANTHSAGNQAFHFIGAQAFHSHGTHHVYGELRYQNHILSGDVNGDGKADFEIHVNAASLAKGDFIL